MKTLVISLASVIALSGCVVTGGVEYTDPKTGAVARLGINQEIKNKPDAKRVVPLEQ